MDTARFGGVGLTPHAKNTNRHWFEELTPETKAVRDAFDEVKAKDEKLVLAMDLHAGGVFRNYLLFSFQEGYLEDTVARSQMRWRRLLQEKAGIRWQEGREKPLGRCRAVDWFLQTFNCPAFTLELSSSSYYHPRLQRICPFEQEALNILSQGLYESIVTFINER